MRIRRDVEQYAVAWLFGWPKEGLDNRRRELELTPQLIRLSRRYRRDLECRSIHAAAQRMALAMCFSRSGYRRNMMILTKCSLQAVRHAVGSHRKMIGGIPATKIALGRKYVLEDPVRSGAATRKDAHAAAGLDILTPEEFPDALKKGEPTPSAGSLQVLLSKPDIRPRDGNDELIKGLEKPKTLGGPDSRHAIDEMYAELYANSPWLQETIGWMWRQHLEMLKADHPHLWMPPFVLVGPPGSGKTYLLQSLARMSDLPYIRIDMSGLTANFALSGLEGGWNGARPGEPVSALARNDVANPIILLDELEKAGQAGNAASPYDAMLPLLQRETARDFRCPAIRAGVDLSHVIWAAAANSVDNLPAPLLDRMTVLQCDLPKGSQLRELVERRIGELAVDRAVIERVILEMQLGRLSLRGLDRIERELRRIDGAEPLH